MASRPKGSVLVVSDSGSQFTNIDKVVLMKHHYREHSMNRRKNRHAVEKSFLERQRIRHRPTRLIAWPSPYGRCHRSCQN